MHIFLTILAIVAIVLVVVMVVLYFLGKKMQKKQDESQAQMQAASQTATILVIEQKADEIKRFRSSKDGFGKHTEISPWLKSTDCQS